MSRAAPAVIIGFLFMLIAPFMFTEWEVNAQMGFSLVSIFNQIGTDPIGVLSTWFGLGFHGDGSFFRFFSGFTWYTDPNVREILWMTIMAWFSTAFLIGLIAKGAKRSTFAALAVYIVYFALHLIFTVLVGEDLTFMFTSDLMDTLGVLLTGVLFSILGGVIGGAVSGAGEE